MSDYTTLRYRKHDTSHNVLVAVQKWLIDNGGKAMVLGGIGIIERDGAGNFYVAVGVTGRLPQRRLDPQKGRR